MDERAKRANECLDAVFAVIARHGNFPFLIALQATDGTVAIGGSAGDRTALRGALEQFWADEVLDAETLDA